MPASRVIRHEPLGVAVQFGQFLRVNAVIRATDLALAVDQDEAPVVR